MNDSVLLQQFARFPRLGQVKTRLQQELGETVAYQTHCELLSLTNRQLLAAQLGPVELWLELTGTHAAVDGCIASGALGPRLQQGPDLGARMIHALNDGLARFHRVLLVGSDCPGLDAGYLAAARDGLDEADLVFGPAEDGGFVLIAAREALAPGLFAGVRWGEGDVLAQCEARAVSAGLTARRLKLRYDIDRPEDLRRWRRESLRRERR